MMLKRITRLAMITAVVGTAAAAALVITRPTQAHEERKVGPYTLHVGWHVEPTLIGQLNAVELIVTEDSKPVADVEKTLTVTLSTRGQTSDALNFTVSNETPGLYTAALIPTATGDYQFHLVGTIGTTKVDETFDSAKGLFNGVDPVNNLEFPVKLPSTTDLQKEIDDLKAQIAALKGASTVSTGALPTAAATVAK